MAETYNRRISQVRSPSPKPMKPNSPIEIPNADAINIHKQVSVFNEIKKEKKKSEISVISKQQANSFWHACQPIDKYLIFQGSLYRKGPYKLILDFAFFFFFFKK